jgi:hypothetical protein
MQQDISMVYLNEHHPVPQCFTPADIGSILGDRYCSVRDLVVLEKDHNEITVITTVEDSICADELTRTLFNGKNITVKVTERQEIHQFFTKICDYFGLVRH